MHVLFMRLMRNDLQKYYMLLLQSNYL